MTSPTPLLYDTYYHIYNRGVNRGNIFFEERNYEYFLKLYEKHIAPVVDTFGYCLLRNHFHVAVKVKSEDDILETLRVSPNSRISSTPTPKRSTKPTSAPAVCSKARSGVYRSKPSASL